MEELRRQNPGKVPIHIVEKRAYIWEAEDAAFVRREHHICGLLSGTLPLIPQQNVFLGLPLQLFNEEVVYLVRAGAAFLVDDPSSHLIPTSSQAISFWKSHDSDASSQQVRSLRAQREASRLFEEKLSASGSLTSASQEKGKESKDSEEVKASKAREALEKRKKREEAKRMREEERKRKEGAEELELFDHNDYDHQDEDEDQLPTDQNKENSKQGSILRENQDGSLELPNAETIRSKASRKGQNSTIKSEEEEASSLPYSYLTPGSSVNSKWYRPSITSDGEGPSKPTVCLTLSSASTAGIWNFPSNRRDRALCAAFEALHAKGYYMGVGLRFGGDFVVYPGDPLRYHSHFTATVQTSTTTMISTLELIASGRLGTAVKKAHLLCGVSLSQHSEFVDVEGEDESSTKSLIESGQMDRAKLAGGEQESGASWGTVTFYSLTWAGFGT